MTQTWEYHWLYIHPGTAEFMGKLSNVGERGWELTGIISVPLADYVWLLFKRPLMSKVTTQETTVGPFDEYRFTELRLAYEANLKEELTQFEFEGHTWARSYAHHMLEYLSPLLGFGEYKKPS